MLTQMRGNSHLLVLKELRQQRQVRERPRSRLLQSSVQSPSALRLAHANTCGTSSTNGLSCGPCICTSGQPQNTLLSRHWSTRATLGMQKRADEWSGGLQAMKVAAAFGNSSMLAKRVRDLKDEHIELECYRQVCIRCSHLQAYMFPSLSMAVLTKLPLQSHGSWSPQPFGAHHLRT